MSSVRVRTLRAFRNGTEGMVKAGREIEVSTQRASDLVAAGLVTYAVGGKMEPKVKNKMDEAARSTKEAAPKDPVPTETASAASPPGGQTGRARSSRSSSRPARRRKKST